MDAFMLRSIVSVACSADVFFMMFSLGHFRFSSNGENALSFCFTQFLIL
jgi:hypothetical protein